MEVRSSSDGPDGADGTTREMPPMTHFRPALALALAIVANSARAQEAGFLPLFDGTDLSQWIVPEGDNGHWKIVEQGGQKVIDYDARSEATGNKNLVSKREFGDFVLKMEWRLKEAPYTNPNVFHVLPDGSHARGI